MSNDPYSWCNVEAMDKMIKETRTEFKKEEMEEELKELRTSDPKQWKRCIRCGHSFQTIEKEPVCISCHLLREGDKK